MRRYWRRHRHAALLGALAFVVLGLVAWTFLATRGGTGTPQAQPPQTPRASHASQGGNRAPTALWIGDSYTAGTGATSRLNAESLLTCRRLGWSCDLDAQGGTGFISPGTLPGYRPIPARLRGDERRYRHLDVVVVDGGRNDTRFRNQPGTPQVAATFIADVHKAWPSARLVVIAPYFMTSATEPVGTGFVDAEKAATQAAGGTFIDPIAQGWIPVGAAYQSATAQGHPSDKGHRWIAAHLAHDLRGIG